MIAVLLALFILLQPAAPDPKTFLAAGANTYFILEPGYRLTLEGTEAGKRIQLVITVLDETRVVDGVTTRVVEERESENGRVIEISRNYFAFDPATTSSVLRDGRLSPCPSRVPPPTLR